jgi:LysM repeat protein
LPLSPPTGGTLNPAYAQPSPYSQGAAGQSPYGTSNQGGTAEAGAVVVAAPVVDPENYSANPAATPASRPSIYGATAAGQNPYPPPVIDGAGAAPATGSAASAVDGNAFLLAWRGAQDQLAKGDLAGALETLTLWHDSEDVPPEMQSQLNELLDQLAGAVVYSTEHVIEPPHEVRAGETLEDIANQMQVPWQLLANINGIADPAQLQPGMQLKLVRGPINAVVHLEKKELTLLAGRHYAGRFAVGLGNDPAPMTGEYVVREKAEEKTYYDHDARAIPPGDEANPYGPFWIGLQGRLGIHGAAPAPRSGERKSTGSINVSPDDARDLYAILSKDSRVIIRQ